MKKGIFLIATVLSVISFAFAGILLGIYFTQENPGMIMVFLVPLLVFGILFTAIAFLLKAVKNVELSPILIRLHYINLFLFVLGLVALIFTLSE